MGYDIQGQIVLILGIAVAVERIIEVFWIALKYFLSQGLSFDFRDFDNKNHQAYSKYKQFKEVASIVLAVLVGICLAYLVKSDGKDNLGKKLNWTEIFTGSIGGLISPNAHLIIKAGLNYTNVLPKTKDDTSKTLTKIEEAVEFVEKLDQDLDSTACCFLCSAWPDFWHLVMDIVTCCSHNHHLKTKIKEFLVAQHNQLSDKDVASIFKMSVSKLIDLKGRIHEDYATEIISGLINGDVESVAALTKETSDAINKKSLKSLINKNNSLKSVLDKNITQTNVKNFLSELDVEGIMILITWTDRTNNGVKLDFIPPKYKILADYAKNLRDRHITKNFKVLVVKQNLCSWWSRLFLIRNSNKK